MNGITMAESIKMELVYLYKVVACLETQNLVNWKGTIKYLIVLI